MPSTDEVHKMFYDAELLIEQIQRPLTEAKNTELRDLVALMSQWFETEEMANKLWEDACKGIWMEDNKVCFPPREYNLHKTARDKANALFADAQARIRELQEEN